ncbi:MAG: 2-oxoacid:acceptor oxidoreductase subunit alpha [Verrucomicrobiales bacterium]|jgi:2-oxoglutarate ferredoxin oxidoreductase subunit alpha|nr:2-oxoacid:acceptor oxidoreductase subunit alpha [Verrucomicrobiales bacterium]
MSASATSGNPETSESLSASSDGITELQNAVIRFAGNSQDGIQTIGGFLARLAGRSAREVMTYMTIPSTISGGASIFQVHLGSGEVLSAGDEADFLVAFYQDSYNNHIDSLKAGGICIYDSDHVEELQDIDGVRHVGIPITSTTVEAIGGSARDRGKNIFVLGLVTQLFSLNKEKLTSLIEKQLGRKGEGVLRNAMLAFDSGYAYPIGDLLGEGFDLQEGEQGKGDKVTTDGNTALTLGLLAGGVRYGAGYPITPWSTIMEQLRSELPKYGGLFVQCEDELAAVSMALGFAYSGHTAVTGSSGPGLSLKMEALSYATMAELPIVVINVQRGGPSTGLPTSVEQSDLMQAIYGSHGDCPRIVLAPKNVEDCFYIAVEACELARKYSCPVLVLTDQALATRIEAFAEPDLANVIQEPVLDQVPRGEEFKPYPLDGLTKHAPPGTPMEGGKYPVVTGLEHDEWGHPSGSPVTHAKMNAKRREKIKSLGEELSLPEIYGDESGDVLLVGWGSTWGPIRESVNRLRDAGREVGTFHLRHLNPLPNGLEELFARYKHVVVVEMNDEGLYGVGQLATLLRSRYCDPRIVSICKTDGLTYKVREIIERLDVITG